MNILTGWRVISESGIVHEAPCVLFGVSFTSGVLGDSVTLYEGQSADAARKIATVKCKALDTKSWAPPSPLALSRGLYAAVSGTSPEVTVFFDPVDARA